MRTLVRGLLLLALMAVPASARAATVSLTRDDLGPRLSFAADPGEANRLSIEEAADGALIVRDDRARLRSGDRCSPLGAHAARCGPPTAPASVLVDLGDRGDEARLADARRNWTAVEVLGGNGRDTIDISAVRLERRPQLTGRPEVDGGAGGDRIAGSRAGDRLDGGAGADLIDGRRGADTLVGDPAGRVGRDILIGGPGRDTVDYSTRRTSVVVDLARGVGGTRGREDVLREIENVVGGRAHDVLRGTSGPNDLAGWADVPDVRRDELPGDAIAGRGGDDVLVDFAGASRLDGGAGDDLIVGARYGDRLSCGPGSDTLTRSNGSRERGSESGAGLESGVLVPPDCEVIAIVPYSFGPIAVVGMSRLVVRVESNPQHDQGRLTVRGARGAVLGRASFSGTGRVRVELNAAGRRAAHDHAVVGVHVYTSRVGREVAWHVRL